MKRFPVLILISAALLFTLGCDRFTHTFEPPVIIDFQSELFTPLQTAFSGQPEAGLDAVMDYFADDYLHFGLTKFDRRTWLQGIYAAQPEAEATVSLLNSEELSDSTAVANWRLKITAQRDTTVLADSTFTGERLALRGGHWLLRGNRLSAPLPTPQQHIVVEYFTFMGCPSCPPVEAKLHELQLEHPDRLSYVEQHISGPLNVYGDDSNIYYGVSSVPFSVIQGETSLAGSTQAVLDEYDTQVNALLDTESPIRYTILDAGIDGTFVSGSVDLQVLEEGFSQENLWLYYVLIEKESSYTNTWGQHLRNVIRARGRKNLSAANLDEPVSFNFECLVPLPDDPALVLFVQTRPDTFANNSPVHGGIEIPLSRLAK